MPCATTLSTTVTTMVDSTVRTRGSPVGSSSTISRPKTTDARPRGPNQPMSKVTGRPNPEPIMPGVGIWPDRVRIARQQGGRVLDRLLVAKEGLREQPGELLRAEQLAAGVVGLDPVPDGDRVDGAASGRSGRSCEHQAVQASRVAQCELDPDHGAHRQAEQMGAVHVERVEQAGDVISHVGDGVGVLASRAAPTTPPSGPGPGPGPR